jgi:hypothetical protein
MTRVVRLQLATAITIGGNVESYIGKPEHASQYEIEAIAPQFGGIPHGFIIRARDTRGLVAGTVRVPMQNVLWWAYEEDVPVARAGPEAAFGPMPTGPVEQTGPDLAAIVPEPARKARPRFVEADK